MAGYLAMFLLIVMFITAWSFVAQAEMLAADCTFGKVHTTEAQNMSATLIGKLPVDKHMSHSCVVRTDGVNHHKHFFQVKAKRNKESKGFLHLSAYGTDESQLLGHLDVSKSEADWSSLTLCPRRYKNEVQDKYLSFSGTPNLAFTIQIDSSPQEIKLNEPITKDVSSESVRVFQFIPAEDISNTQLDVTVTSESADVPAYLKVSRDCKDVKDNIDNVDYKGESLRLSFSKKGRITLSKVSIPPLTKSTSSWFIGIGIKNATGNTPISATKDVRLELSRSFDYSYDTPICLLVFVLSIIPGLVVSISALCCFQGQRLNKKSKDSKKESTSTSYGSRGLQIVVQGEPGQESSSNTTEKESKDSKKESASTSYGSCGLQSVVQGKQGQESSSNTTEKENKDSKKESASTSYGSGGLQSVVQGKQGQESSSNTTEKESKDSKKESASTSYGSLSLQSVVQGKQGQESSSDTNETDPLLRIPDEKPEQNQNQNKNRCCQVLEDWSPKTYSYSYITAIVGFVLMIGAGQFVFANWHLMQQEGDRDNCYYNDFCYRVSLWHDIPFNLMISNLVYMLHGLILAVSVFIMEVIRLKPLTRNEGGKEAFDPKDLPPKQAFSIGYAFAWALIFEGGFSLVYHLCPSKLTFQFDTAFMFVISGLIVILLYNGIEMKECSGAKSPVGAGGFFLYFLVPLYIFNYFGTLRHSETGLHKVIDILFFIFLICWWVFGISIWTAWKLGFCDENCTCSCGNCTIIVLFVLGVVAPFLCFLSSMSNLPQVFLIACIAESVIASFGKVLFRCIQLFECSCGAPIASGDGRGYKIGLASMAGGDGPGNEVGGASMAGRNGHGYKVGLASMAGGDGPGNEVGGASMAGGDGHGYKVGWAPMASGNGPRNEVGGAPSASGNGPGNEVGGASMAGGDGPGYKVGWAPMASGNGPGNEVGGASMAGGDGPGNEVGGAPKKIFCKKCICNKIKGACTCCLFCRFLYVVAMAVVWGFALYYFFGKQTTDKVKAPEISRNLNRECEWFGFFDSHDIWHLLSSHGLLMMVYFVMYMSSE